jgi:hypothetical protein
VEHARTANDEGAHAEVPEIGEHRDAVGPMVEDVGNE